MPPRVASSVATMDDPRATIHSLVRRNLGPIKPVKSVADAARELGVSYKQAVRMLKKALTTMRAVISRMEVNRLSGGNANGHPSY